MNEANWVRAMSDEWDGDTMTVTTQSDTNRATASQHHESGYSNEYSNNIENLAAAVTVASESAAVRAHIRQSALTATITMLARHRFTTRFGAILLAVLTLLLLSTTRFVSGADATSASAAYASSPSPSSDTDIMPAASTAATTPIPLLVALSIDRTIDAPLALHLELSPAELRYKFLAYCVDARIVTYDDISIDIRLFARQLNERNRFTIDEIRTILRAVYSDGLSESDATDLAAYESLRVRYWGMTIVAGTDSSQMISMLQVHMRLFIALVGLFGFTAYNIVMALVAGCNPMGHGIPTTKVIAIILVLITSLAVPISIFAFASLRDALRVAPIYTLGIATIYVGTIAAALLIIELSFDFIAEWRRGAFMDAPPAKKEQ